MNLSACQHSVIEQILHDDAPLPEAWDNARMQAGLAIYRNGYRSRLVDALAETFPRTRQWVGEESFERAAAHHHIVNPPSHWSLDRAGQGFAETLTTLFARDPEVPELAQLEWDMHLAFVASDAAPMDAAGFSAATAAFADDEWESLRLVLQPALTIRPVRSAVAGIWRALSESTDPPHEPMLAEPAYLLVWRDGAMPVFRTAAADEAACLQLVRDGATFGELCLHLARTAPEDAAANAGKFLGTWLDDALIVGLR